MAAPPEVTTKAMSGKFVMNKSLSDSTEEILRLQDAAGVEHIDIQQIFTGGFSESENRVLDGIERHAHDSIFSYVTEKARRIPVEEITDEFLKKDWTPDTIENDIVLTDAWSTPSKNSHTWRAVQTWGFAMVNGERRYVRHTTFTSPEKDPIHARFVYDYIGPINI